MTEKRTLRRVILARLRRQSDRARRARSARIAQRLRRLRLYRNARSVLCYVAVRGEVETRPILARILADGKRLCVPAVRGRTLIAAEILDPARELKPTGRFGIPQPSAAGLRRVDPRRLDLVLLPGVAFDRAGRRMGRGGGYFDRFLERLPARIPRVGLAFRFQVVRRVPQEPHDRPVDRVITD